MNKLVDLFPDIATEWHPTKNCHLDLLNTSYGSAKKVWWLCPRCGYEYQMRIDTRTGKRRCSCPVCKRSKKLYPLSITHPQLAVEWSSKNERICSEYTAGSHDLIWWIGECGHEWQATIGNRTKPSRPSGCPYCNNRKVDKTNSLEMIFPEISKEWHPNKNLDLKPCDVVHCSYKKVWWLGECGHEWAAIVKSRTRPVNPTGCPICKNSRGERKIEKILLDKSIPYQKQVRFPTCRDKNCLPFDFMVGDNVLIEFQGIQHYVPTNFGGDYLKAFQGIQKRDKIKKDWCSSNGFNLVLIPYFKLAEIKDIIENKVLSFLKE